jgi:hypothetical protein
VKRSINMLGSYCQEGDRPGFSTSPDAFRVIPCTGGSGGEGAAREGEAVIERPGVETKQSAGVYLSPPQPTSRDTQT